MNELSSDYERLEFCMGARFTVLASGSSGNAAIFETDQARFLLDGGLTGRELGARMEQVGLNWTQIHGMLLTHTHSDHWNDGAFGRLLKNRATLFCHVAHRDRLMKYSRVFPLLHGEGLVREYQNDDLLTLAPGVSCRPIAVRHDSGPTFGFRLEALCGLFGEAIAMGYASDLGCWDDVIASSLANVDVLAIEHNHDVKLQLRSRRPRRLIHRCLGNEGHLSNLQAAALVKAVLQKSDSDRLKCVVALHLSQECNRPSLASATTRHVLTAMNSDARILTASQDLVTTPVHLGEAKPKRRRANRRSGGARRRKHNDHPRLPGFGPDEMSA